MQNLTRTRAFAIAFAIELIAAVNGPYRLRASDAGANRNAIFYLSDDRGPVRHVNLSPLTQEVSSEILTGPTNGLDSAFILYTRMAAGARKKSLYTLPVDHTYLVLSGKLNVQLGTDEFVAERDTLVLVPAGVPYRAWNAGSEPEADLEVVTPAPSRDLASMMKEAKPRKVDNAAELVRVAPPLGPLKGGVGHEGLNERVLAARASGSEHVLERLDDVPPGAGGPSSHLHPFDQVYFVTAGTMTVQYGLGKYEVTPNSLVVIPAGIVHSNLNNGSTVESHITLLLPEPEKGTPFGASAEIKPQGPPGQGREETRNPGISTINSSHKEKLACSLAS